MFALTVLYVTALVALLVGISASVVAAAVFAVAVVAFFWFAWATK